MGAHAWLTIGLDLLFPPHCAVCGQRGAWLCPACLGGVHRFEPPWCPRCGQPRRDGGLCRACRQAKGALTSIRSVGGFAGPLRPAIHALKYQGLRVLAEPLGELLAEAWRRQPWPVDVLVPVPLHRVRLWRRGYNQAELLARAVGQHIALPVEASLLTRYRDTHSQVGLAREERRHNMRNAFAVGGGAVAGRRVLLIDDVLTTGATLEACAEALCRAGADAVHALTLARAGWGAPATRRSAP